MDDFLRISSIAQVYEALGLSKAYHPLVSVFSHHDLKSMKEYVNIPIHLDLYHITFKMCSEGVIQYGRNSYDFQEGTMLFTRPGQVLSFREWREEDGQGGWTLFFHPDLIRKSDLGNNIDQYRFFDYDVNEALHLSEDEKKTLLDIIDKIIKEYTANLDRHSQKLIVSNIELLLDYCIRFYDRQFYTRTNLNSDFVSRYERWLSEYMKSESLKESGLPSVALCADHFNLSPSYLSDMLKKETGKSAQEHIHYYIIDRAKTILLNSQRTIGEIAYELGFEYPQYFSRLFKAKTGLTPGDFREICKE